MHAQEINFDLVEIKKLSHFLSLKKHIRKTQKTHFLLHFELSGSLSDVFSIIAHYSLSKLI